MRVKSLESKLNCSLDVSNPTHILSESGLSLQTQFVQVIFKKI